MLYVYDNINPTGVFVTCHHEICQKSRLIKIELSCAPDNATILP